MRLVCGLDIETTGLEWSKGHRIIEIAAVLYDLDTGLKVASFVKRCNPQRPIEPKALEVHGISFEDVCNLEPFEALAPMVSRIIRQSHAIVAHNGIGFDKPFIMSELARVGQPAPDILCVDTMLQARWATPLGKLPNLGELCFATDTEYDKEKAHGAEYDVEVMMNCFFKGYRKGFFSVPAIQPAAIAA